MMLIAWMKLRYQRDGDAAQSTSATKSIPRPAGSSSTYIENAGRPSPTFMIYRNFTDFVHPPRSWRSLLVDEDGTLQLNQFIAVVIQNSSRDVFVVTDMLRAYPCQTRPGPTHKDAPFIDLNWIWPEDLWDKQFIVLPPGYTVAYIMGKVKAVGGWGCLESARERLQLVGNNTIGLNSMRLNGFRQICIYKHPTRTFAIDYKRRGYPATTNGGAPNRPYSSYITSFGHPPTSMGQQISISEEGPPDACWESHLLIAPPGFAAGYCGNTLAYFFRSP